ncbi:hypothetical protein Q2K19_28925 [Micromonospora soli]|uniref:hypothetical protein n=1 Tax=Micromonospora sp. NBRC 110009 TaxID=3061627 RepID=UPI002673F057|nr:hypothetical protein [Micromonospora sp. NBRC 110009]WKT98147.1 hypothetical protein Q2K19_28925 [Micromonospora sp. NBRC 110009]
MRPRGWWPVAALLTAAALTGCARADGAEGPQVPGCTVPQDEDTLLDAYADDPVLAVRPEGAQRIGKLARSSGCHQLNKEDVSNTAVTLSWRPSRDYDDTSLRQIYDPVAGRAGWRYAVDPDAPPDGPGVATLTYCRRVRGVTSRLLIRAQAAQLMDVRPSTPDRPPSPQWSVVSPALIYLTIYAAPACPRP